MEINQTVVFSNRPYGKYITIYRGGFDRKTKKGIDPCKRSDRPVDDLIKTSVSRYWNYPKYPIEDGLTLGFSEINKPFSDQFISIGKFFFGENFEDQVKDLKTDEFVAVDGEWITVFTCCEELVFYKKDKDHPFTPKKVTKDCTKASKFYKTWNSFGKYTVDTKKHTVRGYNFSSVDFQVIRPISSNNLFRNFLPEYGKRVYKKLQESWEDYFLRLYDLQPIDLSESWSYTSEEISEFQKEADKKIAELRQAERELEERKKTPGYCENCGEPASLVVDPYEEDMYGVKIHKWLCPRCFDSYAGDI